MEGRALSDDGIVAFNATVVPFAHITTRIPGRKRDGLLKEKGFTGFPTICFMNPRGEVLYKVPGTDRTLEGFARAKKRVDEFLALSERAAAGDRDAAKRLLWLRFDLGNIAFDEATRLAAGLDLSADETRRFNDRVIVLLAQLDIDEARERLAGLTLDAGQRQRAARFLADIRIRDTCRVARESARKNGRRADLRPVFYRLFKDGVLPSDEPRTDFLYWSAVMQAAEGAIDPDAFAAAWRKLAPFYAKNESYTELMRKRLSALRAKAAEEKQ